jgi:type III secretory pathway component EscU
VSAAEARAVPGRVGRPDIEAKLRQIRQEVDRTTEAAKPVAAMVVGAAAVVVIGLVYLAGRRRGRKGRTVVEVRRV